MNRNTWPVPYCIHSPKTFILRERKGFILKCQTQDVSCTPFSWFLNMPAFVNISHLYWNMPVLAVDLFMSQSSVNLPDHIIFLRKTAMPKALMPSLSMRKVEQGTKHAPLTGRWRSSFSNNIYLFFSTAAGARGLLCPGPLPQLLQPASLSLPCFSLELLSHISAVLPFVNICKCSICWRSKVLTCLDLVWRASKLTHSAPSSTCLVDTAMDGAAPIYLLL